MSTSANSPNSVLPSAASKIQIFKDLAQQTAVVYKHPHPPVPFKRALGQQRALFSGNRLMGILKTDRCGFLLRSVKPLLQTKEGKTEATAWSQVV